jgi:hypothetical protein
VQHLLGQVAIAALDSSLPNWKPGGDFVHEAYLFAPGAISWHKFYVYLDKAWPGIALADAGAKRNYVRLATAAAKARGDECYIPPDKYYFPCLSNAALPLDKNVADYCLNSSGVPYGFKEHEVYRKALEHSSNAVVKLIDMASKSAYTGSTYDNIYGTRNNRMNAYAEQCKTTCALLFEGICDYPRKVSQFFNPAANNAMRAHLDVIFNNGSNTDDDFAYSIRFRNWMRYGVDVMLLSVGTQLDPAANRLDVFNAPTKAMETGSAVLDIENIRTFLPWNKITPTHNMIGPEAQTDSPDAPCHYSTFAISVGGHTHAVNTWLGTAFDANTDVRRVQGTCGSSGRRR